MQKIQEIKTNFDQDKKEIKTLEDVQNIKVKYLGKKGLITGLMILMKEVEDKKEFGQQVNEIKEYTTLEITKIENTIEEQELEKKLKESEIDVTLPGRAQNVGQQNVLIKTRREIEDIFLELGFEVAIGQEVETDYHNFEALNLDKDHPARDMQDTFYLNPHELLRTHTSNIQSRVLSSNPEKEIKIICPGKVYRRDDDDATHSHQFMQVEGLVVVRKDSDYTASLQDLKTMLTIFVNKVFNKEELEIRMRPSYFPFTEPSVEVDVTCSSCLGSGCSFCKRTGFIEILGAGIINKNVLEIAGYNSDEYTGYAFGIGVERIALLKYNIEDIRNLYTNDLRFIKQFKK